jgi:hypothetical protein
VQASKSMNFKPEVLYTAKAVRGAITALLSDPTDERIVVSAFVGNGAEGLLPNAEGIQLICSPTPGGTSPNALRMLMSKGVEIRFSDRLHMKVYWSSSHGAVITSANLSLNALGQGGLKEIGVRLPTQQIDIRRIIASVRPRAVTETELKRLDRKHREFVARNRWSGPPQTMTFDEWYRSPYREQWKMFVYAGFDEISATGVAAIEREFGTNPHAGIAATDGDYLTQDWVLCVHMPNGRIADLEWFFVDRILSIPRGDPAWNRRWPKEALQSRSLKSYPPTPFKIDRQFRLDLGRVMNKSDAQRLKHSTIPPPSLLKRLIDLKK